MIKMILRYLKISDKNGYLVYSLIIQYNMRASPHIAPNNATTSKTHLQCQISIQNQSPDFRQIHDKNYVFISWNTITALQATHLAQLKLCYHYQVYNQQVLIEPLTLFERRLIPLDNVGDIAFHN